ncbi:hypothetical protein MB84_28365 (plasmid) [Pandoraea oxalativorans]|uniref:Transposase IS4-like domain-containing protein n=2 Tax=Pandoraea oxalativorans TaxID=573737 RepID=A0A0G3ICL2_9BURK|nr:transposase [Pandoraea oxalativorans]AKK24919.1 hypothetical protein MB84_28365 [Pandoraea oxalativorans]
MLTAEGQVPDISRAHERVAPSRTGLGFADTGHDADDVVSALRAARAKAVIAPRSNRKTERRCSRVRHRTRNGVERFSHRIQYFRRVCRRDDTPAGHYPALTALARAWGRPVRMCTGPGGTFGGVGA